MSKPERSPHPGWMPPVPAPPARPPLVRAIVANPNMPAPWMDGMCSGLAVHLGVSIALVRVAVVCLSVVSVGIDAYLWLWMSIPEDGPEQTNDRTLSPDLVRLREERANQMSRNHMIVVGVALIVAAIAGTVLNATNTLD